MKSRYSYINQLFSKWYIFITFYHYGKPKEDIQPRPYLKTLEHPPILTKNGAKNLIPYLYLFKQVLQQQQKINYYYFTGRHTCLARLGPASYLYQGLF